RGMSAKHLPIEGGTHDSRQQGGKIVKCLDRRRLLKLSGAGAIAASSGGIAAILASGRAPAYAQATALHWLRWSDFVPASDQVSCALKSCRIARRRSASSSTSNLSTPTTSRRALPRRSNPGRVPTSSSWSTTGRSYADSVVDVSEVAEAIGTAQ